MTDEIKIFRQLTQNFSEVKSLIDEHHSLKKQLSKVNRKLETFENKYRFLIDIVSIGGDDKIIEIAAKQLFKNAGFNDVRHLENVKPKREDLQIWFDDCLVIIECKGSKNAILRDSELGEVLKYVNYRKLKIGSEVAVYGLTIVNHDNQKPFYSRNENSIDTHKNDYAIAGNYGIITTAELVAGFLMMKNNEITFEDFKSNLKKSGTIKFSAVQKKSDK